MKIILTKERIDELTTELEHLESEGRHDIAEKIKVALSFGDLSENSEYDEAKNEQGKIEARIAELKAILSRVEILDSENLTTEKVQLGNKITIKNLTTNESAVWTIVGSQEVKVKEHKISDVSPVGTACMGHAVGDTVDVETPRGTVRYEITDISK